MQDDEDEKAARIRREMRGPYLRSRPSRAFLQTQYNDNGRSVDDPEPINLPLVLLASWLKTPLGNPKAWRLDPLRAETQFGVFNGSVYTVFARVVKAIRVAMPSEVAAMRENRQDEGVFEAGWETPANAEQLVVLGEAMQRCLALPKVKRFFRLSYQHGSGDDEALNKLRAMPGHIIRAVMELFPLMQAVTKEAKEILPADHWDWVVDELSKP